MSEKNSRLEEYRRSGHYYIPDEKDDLLWTDEAGEWKMSANARNLRSCMDLDRVSSELDESGYEIILAEFCLEPDRYNLEQIRHMNPLELEK